MSLWCRNHRPVNPNWLRPNLSQKIPESWEGWWVWIMMSFIGIMACLFTSHVNAASEKWLWPCEANWGVFFFVLCVWGWCLGINPVLVHKNWMWHMPWALRNWYLFLMKWVRTTEPKIGLRKLRTWIGFTCLSVLPVYRLHHCHKTEDLGRGIQWLKKKTDTTATDILERVYRWRLYNTIWSCPIFTHKLNF